MFLLRLATVRDHLHTRLCTLALTYDGWTPRLLQVTTLHVIKADTPPVGLSHSLSLSTANPAWKQVSAMMNFKLFRFSNKAPKA